MKETTRLPLNIIDWRIAGTRSSSCEFRLLPPIWTSCTANLSLAIMYFKMAARSGNIEATYKLGDLYSTDKWGI